SAKGAGVAAMSQAASSDADGRSPRGASPGSVEPLRGRSAKPRRAGARIIAGPPPERDPQEIERERLLERLLAAEGRPSISASVDAYLAGGFELPDQQAVWLQLLEHNDEARVAD